MWNLKYKCNGQMFTLGLWRSIARRGNPRMLLWASLGLGLLFAMALQCSAQLVFADTCAEIRADTIRLHVKANSNSVQDQTIKLQVRDAVLALLNEEYAKVQATQEAPLSQAQSMAIILQQMPQISLVAGKAARQAGQSVTVSVTESYFDTTTYDDAITLPAGQYTALTITLGAAEGKNWWCVLYPSFCVSAASESAQYTTEAENEVVSGAYEVRFAALAWWQGLQQEE